MSRDGPGEMDNATFSLQFRTVWYRTKLYETLSYRTTD